MIIQLLKFHFKSEENGPSCIAKIGSQEKSKEANIRGNKLNEDNKKTFSRKNANTINEIEVS